MKIKEAKKRLMAQLLSEDSTVLVLDDYVHDAKAAEATNINNGGLDSQLRYIKEQGDLDRVVAWVEQGSLEA